MNEKELNLLVMLGKVYRMIQQDDTGDALIMAYIKGILDSNEFDDTMY